MREFGKVWEFKTDKLRVELRLEHIRDYQYDGDDPDGEAQAKLDSGEYVAFESTVSIYLRDDDSDNSEEIGWANLGGSVYARGEVHEFYTMHRTPDPMERNCTIMRASRGYKTSICYYFPDMVREACQHARQTLERRMEMMPKLRSRSH